MAKDIRFAQDTRKAQEALEYGLIDGIMDKRV